MATLLEMLRDRQRERMNSALETNLFGDAVTTEPATHTHITTTPNTEGKTASMKDSWVEAQMPEWLRGLLWDDRFGPPLTGVMTSTSTVAATTLPKPETHAYTDAELEKIKADAFEAGKAAADSEWVYTVEPEPKNPLPIHRAMRTMLHADERYANRVFMPGGLLASEE